MFYTVYIWYYVYDFIIKSKMGTAEHSIGNKQIYIRDLDTFIDFVAMAN